MRTRWFSFSFGLLLIFSSGVYHIPYSVEAQGTPQYNDVSNGLPVQSLWVSKVRFNDMDEDGTDEVLFLGPRKGAGDMSLHVMQWNGNSWANVSSTFGTENIDHYSYGGFDFGDLDNDGDLDVVAGSHGHSPVTSFHKESGGNWGESEIVKDCEDCDSQDAWSIDVGDYNVDGLLDVLVGGFWDMDLTPFANTGDGGWNQQGEGIAKGRASNVQAYFVDVNRDGFLDLIANLRDGSWVYLGDGEGGWTDSSTGLPVESGSDDSPFAIDWGDFNNDGFVDLALCTVDFDDAHLYAFSGDGEGGWTDNSVGLPNQAYRTIKLADMNQDKFDDIVGLTPNGVVDTYLATETGGWVKSQTTLQGNAQGWRLEVGDFDNNGHRDIVAGFGTDQTGYPGSVKVWQETTAVTSLGVDVDYPDGMETFQGGSVRFIHWLSEIPTTTEERSIKLEYSTDGIDGDWGLIGEGIPDTGTFQWNVPFENSEDSYIKITLTDELGNSVDDVSDNSFTIISPSNGPPQIELGEPDDVVDDSYTISWVASDPDEDLVTIDLYYDVDFQPDEKILIVSNLENSGEYVWNTTEIEEGEYYLLGVATAASQEESDYTSELLQIDHPDSPIIDIETPQSEGDVVDGSYTISWVASDPDEDELTIELYYSFNDDLENLILIEDQLSNTGEYQWDTSQIEAGIWFICGLASDGELESYDCSEFSLEIDHTKPNNAPKIAIYSPAAFEEIDDVVNIQWSVSDDDGDGLEINLFFRHSSDFVLNPLEYSLDSSGIVMWDTSGLDDGDYYLVMTANDGIITSWKNVSVSVLHPMFIVELDDIQVVPMNPTEEQTVAFYVLTSNIGNVDGSAELIWMVDGVLESTILIDLEEGEEKVFQFSWVATSGEHMISVSTGTTVKTVSISVESRALVEEENALNPWFYSVPVIIAAVGIIFVHRKWAEFRRISDDDDEFEWE